MAERMPSALRKGLHPRLHRQKFSRMQRKWAFLLEFQAMVRPETWSGGERTETDDCLQTKD